MIVVVTTTSSLLLPVLFLIYLPMAAIPYYAYGSEAKANIVNSIAGGWVKCTVEIMLLLHLVSAFPIILNPPAQFFEQYMNIPSGNEKGVRQS